MISWVWCVVLAFLQAELVAATIVRKNVESLTPAELQSLQTHLRELADDASNTGYDALAAYHGEPSQCKDKDGHDRACCVHGDATFPQWHRAYVLQFEQFLIRHGETLGVPYWDWTRPITELPHLVKEAFFKDDEHDLGRENAWFSGDINIGDLRTHTARAPDKRLFEKVEEGHNTHLFDLILDALEQYDYCQFEVQYEIAHNHIHFLVGGRYEYSLATLEYSAFDPLFFLHHSNLDRIFIIWEKLQELRGLSSDHSDCSVELFHNKLEPFSRDSNPIQLTKQFSQAKDLFSHENLGYTYDDFTLNGYNVDQLYVLLEQRRARERAFAVFSLHGVGFSADVRVEVCEYHDVDDRDLSGHHCEPAGDFFILGGHNEMPWEFPLPYYFDISDAVEHLGLELDGQYSVKAEIFHVNGTATPEDILTQPWASHRPHVGHQDPNPAGWAELLHKDLVVRKDVADLTDEEVYELRQALERFQKDTSIDGYQSVAEFHGLPARCPFPDAKDRFACCVHGKATFPHWHRLFVVQFEDALRRRGLHIGIPYWDWTRPKTTIPALANDETYTDPYTGAQVHNPFHDAPVAFLNETTHREIHASLTQDPSYGDHTPLYDRVLLALEQKDFCDFEVQFEVVHNSIHLIVGGTAPYSLATLHYSAFDPIFFLHHSNVDRLWAIWQALQIHRGLPYKAHCAASQTHEPLKPFAFQAPLNTNVKTRDHSHASDVYDFQKDLGYSYDNLLFGGLTIPQLDDYIKTLHEKPRTFVGISLHNIGVSAKVDVYIKHPDGRQAYAGVFSVLGGEREIPWRFDRVYKSEITDALHELNLQHNDEFEVHLQIEDVKGKIWPEDIFAHHTILYEQAIKVEKVDHFGEIHVRSNVETLTREQVQNLREALQALEDDEGVTGYHQIASYHGQPNWCPSPSAVEKTACCPHGMAVFPHWHRLLTEQAENALRAKDLHDGLPYWDWTLPITHLPDIVTSENYINPSGVSVPNPFFHGEVDGHFTTRKERDELFEQPEFGEFTRIAEQVLLAFEQDNFCDFEIQYEVAHNYIHALVGGNEVYSLASLRYTAFDPLFFLHHSNTDRIWAIWQKLQKYRGKPYNSANCALAELHEPLKPFSLTSDVNPDYITREHSHPVKVFDYVSNLHYKYDTLEFNGLSISQLNREIISRQGRDRFFAGFLLHGIGKSALVTFDICYNNECNKAGEFYILGDELEIPWRYDRLFKYEITKQLHEHHIGANDKFTITYAVVDLSGQTVSTDVFGEPTVIRNRGEGANVEDTYSQRTQITSHVRKNVVSLNEGEAESLRAAFSALKADGTFENIAKFHGYPGLCDYHGRRAACCVHGIPTFPHWHRLYVEQLEEELLARGSAVSIPYWDWTQPKNLSRISLISDAAYFNSRTQLEETNPFFRTKIGGIDKYTTRDIQPHLFDDNYFLDNVLLALEQTDFCEFEIQFEIIHNAVHTYVGGRGEYSLSTLDYSAYDPIFFLHHSNVDRIWAIWQALQRYRGKPYNSADCALGLLKIPLQPFNNAELNHLNITRDNDLPSQLFDYHGNLHYRYDTLRFNDWSIPQLEQVLKQRRAKDRLFAGFLLHAVGTSVEVEIYICVPKGLEHGGGKNCSHRAGEFSILGGVFEHPSLYYRLYKYDITEAVSKLGIHVDTEADFDIVIHVHAYNGSYLDPSILRKPTIIFESGEGHEHTSDIRNPDRLVRKNVWSLNSVERRSLVLALKNLQDDTSADGWQSLASFHALPALCPDPSAEHRFACCVHGKPTFPLWHRLYTVQFENALERHGAIVGIPYWDSMLPHDQLPPFFADEKWSDPVLHSEFPNPWAGANIDFDHAHTEREVQIDRLNDKGEIGYDNWQYRQFIFALEQEDYCDFEIQFEIAHNAIHSWIGGSKEHSMGHLHFASYDPIFILHHSFTDRIFAVWQELQKRRGNDPNALNCALELLHEPLKPFSFGSPYNLNPNTKQYATPDDVFDYENHFKYKYDHLDFDGLEIDRLNTIIHNNKENDRTYAGFLLKGIGSSAHVEFSICDDASGCTPAGDFNILGGSAEMPWHFNRLYKYEITHVLEKKDLHYDDPFIITVTITAPDGTKLASDLIPEPSVIFEQGTHQHHEPEANRFRKNLASMNDSDLQSLKSALRDLQKGDGEKWQKLASLHGVPPLCPTPEAAEYACCIHGAPTFPHWHRVYTLMVEYALIGEGSSVSLPYWDWTVKFEGLPELVTTPSYYDFWHNEVVINPFARGYIKEAGGFTVRQVQQELYKTSRDGKHSILFDEVLWVLEQTDYCSFEIQFEVLHNAIHYLVGGRHPYSIASLHYSSYDPLFFLHHSFVDKLWAVWQELQRRRHNPYNSADCAVNFLNEPLHPFDNEQIISVEKIRRLANPKNVFNIDDLDYQYDSLDVGGVSLEDLEKLIEDQQEHDRVFAGFLLHGIGTSADVTFSICSKNKSCTRAGAFFVLGGSKEMPWSYSRLYKYDITNSLKEAGIPIKDIFDKEVSVYLKVEIVAVNGSALPRSVLPPPNLIFKPAHDHVEKAESSAIDSLIRKNINNLDEKEISELKHALGLLKNDSHYFERIASVHGWPGKCQLDGHAIACCQHGMASFPQWHRLYVKLLEASLNNYGSTIGVPYWDWTEPIFELPHLLTDDHDNPFHDTFISQLNVTTSRAPRAQLFTKPGEKSFFEIQILLAFEQKDYCNFEIQYEVTHNALHSWVGGTSEHGLATLEFSAYDPLFFIHHSNVDRQFAIWQALQRYRGLEYNTAHCSIQELQRPLEPFDRVTVNPQYIRDNARASLVFDYDKLHYHYDNLNFHGLTIPQLEELLEKQREKDRIFVNFLLKAIGTSADVKFDLCDKNHKCVFAGTFAILGGPLEVPWKFDRLFKYDVTEAFHQLHLRHDSTYHFEVQLVAVNGTVLDGHLIEIPSVSFSPGRHRRGHHPAHEEEEEHVDIEVIDDLVRYEVSALTLEQITALKSALQKVQQEDGPDGYEAIAGFHGAPGLCPENDTEKYSCCVHGMPVFPAFHRLLTVQFETALKEHGSNIGIPYWDWTRPTSSLPSLFTDVTNNNPFYKYHIDSVDHDTTREVSSRLFDGSGFLYLQALETLEEANYCDFEVQFELLHNALHALVGGKGEYSLSTLDYSAYDPFFLVHHSSIDRIWKIWQVLQQSRHKPFNDAYCARRFLDKPLEPFAYDSVNPNKLTRINSLPKDIFDSNKFHYRYDNLNLNGHNVEEIGQQIKELRDSDRIFAGFVLHGIQTSANVKVSLVPKEGDPIKVGEFYILGGPKEMPWAYERIYKLDITKAAASLELGPYDHFNFKVEVVKYDGTALDTELHPLVIYRPAQKDYDVVVLPLGPDNTLPPKITVTRGTHIRFEPEDPSVTATLREVGSYTNALKCAIPPGDVNSYELNHDYTFIPGDYFFISSDKQECESGSRLQISIDWE